MTQTTRRVLPVNALPDQLNITVNVTVPARALAIGAHPDDIEFGCGATLAKWAGQGAIIHHLILTDGSKGAWDPGRDTKMLVKQRQEEQREAARRLGGGEVTFLGRVDGELVNDRLVRAEVVRCIRQIRPDVVLGHDPWRRYRLHPDHRHAGFIVTDAIVAARDPHFFSDQGVSPHRPTALLLWEADEPNHVEDVAGFAHVKAQALWAHESQREISMIMPPKHEGAPPEGGAPHTSTGHDAFSGFHDRLVDQLTDHGQLGALSQGEAFRLVSEL